MRRLTTEERNEVYKKARITMESFPTYGLCYTIMQEVPTAAVGNSYLSDINISYHFPEFKLFNPRSLGLWWFGYPDRFNKIGHLQRLIVLDFCILMTEKINMP